MSMEPRPLVAGNWKMNGLKTSLAETGRLSTLLKERSASCDVLICPPFTLLMELAAFFAGSAVDLGAQDCHPQKSGAHTGDISAEMLRDCGCSYVIVGHSERRADHGESSELVAQKAAAGQGEDLTTIICVGETEAERDQGKTLDVVSGQLKKSIPGTADPAKTVIAYEPVWAIGSGRTPTAGDVAEVHGMIRTRLFERFGGAGQGLRILYGGSVKPSNASELMAVTNVDGALVGGASLKADDFNGIIDAYRADAR